MPPTPDPQPLSQVLALAGCAAGLGLIVQVYAALLALPLLGALAWWRLARRRQTWIPFELAWFAIPVLVAALFLAWYNVTRFGVPFYSGRTLFIPLVDVPDISVEGRSAITPIADHRFIVGLAGLLLSPGKSFFLYNPVALMALIAAPTFVRRHPGEAAFIGALATLSVAYKAAVPLWHGDWAWGPRYLYHLAPLAVIVALPKLEEWIEGGRGRRLAAIGLLGALVQFGVLLVNVGDYIRLITGGSTEAQRLAWLHFVPLYSPIVGHWLMLVGGLGRAITGASLVLAGPAGQIDYGAGLRVDLWFVLLGTSLPGWLAMGVAGTGLIVLLTLIVSSAGRLVSLAHRGAHPGHPGGAR